LGSIALSDSHHLIGTVAAYEGLDTRFRLLGLGKYPNARWRNTSMLEDKSRVLDPMLVEGEEIVQACVESRLLPLEGAVTPM
jgi:hypothetical protein